MRNRSNVDEKKKKWKKTAKTSERSDVGENQKFLKREALRQGGILKEEQGRVAKDKGLDRREELDISWRRIGEESDISWRRIGEELNKS